VVPDFNFVLTPGICLYIWALPGFVTAGPSSLLVPAGTCGELTVPVHHWAKALLALIESAANPGLYQPCPRTRAGLPAQHCACGPTSGSPRSRGQALGFRDFTLGPILWYKGLATRRGFWPFHKCNGPLAARCSCAAGGSDHNRERGCSGRPHGGAAPFLVAKQVSQTRLGHTAHRGGQLVLEPDSD
jgi:hypothetical protein